mmetsp:Transcript_53109/g.137174  ORF Transcript_53109/g.137174 Transcript_53109/m.137174 type:complete len:542 (-) Transcript_53109:135-1760(-)
MCMTMLWMSRMAGQALLTPSRTSRSATLTDQDDTPSGKATGEPPMIPVISERTRRKSYDLLVEHAHEVYEKRHVPVCKAQEPLTMQYIRDIQNAVVPCGPSVARPEASSLNITVVRGPDWARSDEDGGPGKLGKVVAIDNRACTATVHWLQTGLVKGHYKLPRQGVNSQSTSARDERIELCVAMEEEQEEDPLGSEDDIDVGGANMGTYGRRNSQAEFAEKRQTCIILDWDDTLFPSTYVRDDLRLSLKCSLAQQKVPDSIKQEAQRNLYGVAVEVEQLLRRANSHGQVILVTLAREPWVTDSCRYFFPGIEEVLQELNIKTVYAQQGRNVEYNKMQMMSAADTELYWSRMKGEAIRAHVEDFYSQYRGQTWKNVISIGDSDFERLGTMNAVAEYMVEHGVLGGEASEPAASYLQPKAKSYRDVGSPKIRCDNAGEATVRGKMYRVRTKTFKMLDQPTVLELAAELSLLRGWLPLMVQLDDSFDAEFRSLNDRASIQDIEDALRGATRRKSSVSSWGSALSSGGGGGWSSKDMLARLMSRS